MAILNITPAIAAAWAKENWIRGVRKKEEMVRMGWWTEKSAFIELSSRYAVWQDKEALVPQEAQLDLLTEREMYHG